MNVERQLPEGWRWVKFSDVARHLKEDFDPESGELERYVGGEHMQTDDLRIRNWGTIGDGYLGPAFHRRFRTGQILYGSRRTYLRKVAVADFDGVCANTTFVIEAKPDIIDPDLLPFIMQSDGFNEHSVRNSKGSVNPYVNWGDIASYEFPLPPLDEQRRIAEILWAVEEYRDRLEQVVTELKSLRLVVFDEVARNDESHGNPTRLGDLFTRTPDSGYSVVEENKETGYFVLALQALSFDGYRPGHLKPVALSSQVEATRLTQGDFLISRSNTIELVGLPGIFDEN